MTFSSAFLEELKSRNDITDIISRSVQLRRAGSNLVGLCPFHNEKTPSFTVFPENGSFYCFGCGVGGDVVSFVMKSEGLDYPETVEYLAGSAGIPLETDTNDAYRQPKVKKERVIAANKEAARFFYSSLSSPAGAQARAYLENRGFKTSTIKHFGIGFAPAGWDSLYKHLSSRGFTDEELSTSFLCGISKKGNAFDMFRNRIMFPVFDLKGEVVAFSGRRLDESDERKYINTSDTPVFKKSKILFAMNFAKNTSGEYILCEGAPDTVSLHQAGFTGACATLGTALTGEHARLISRFTKKLYLAYDIDSAGKKATAKGISLLNQVGVETKVIELDQGVKDPDEYIKKFGAAAFRSRMNGASGQIDYNISEITKAYNLSLPDDKLRAVGALTDYISTISSRPAREVYSGRVAELLSLSKKSVFDEVEKKSASYIKKGHKHAEEEAIRNSSGYGDRVNADKLRFSGEAHIEETILSILFTRSDLAVDAAKVLTEDDFFTEFNRKIYMLFKDDFLTGSEVVISKNGILASDEVSAVVRMIAKRRQSGDVSADWSALERMISSLKDRKARQEYNKKITDDPGAGLSEYIEKIRKTNIKSENSNSNN